MAIWNRDLDMNTIVSQALATGMPVIATQHSGLPDQVIDGVNGALVPEGNIDALANCILDLMKHSELWPQMGKLGRAHVSMFYDSKLLIARQIEFYKLIIRGAD